jgi:hypothetical protein
MKRSLQFLMLFAAMAFRNLADGQTKFTFDVLGGLNYNWVRNDVLQGERPGLGGFLGLGSVVTPNSDWKKISFGLVTLLSEKGYNQTLEQHYRLRFYYATIQPLVIYRFSNFISAYGGMEVANLLGTNIKHSWRTYSHTDVGLVGGVRIFEVAPIAINFQVIYGLTPMLNYYKFDQFGNFESITDLRNTCFSVGIRYRIF